MGLADKIMKSAGNPLAALYSKSNVVQGKTEYAPTPVPMLNVALSGKWDGGVSPGITVLAGPSKMGKTFISLILVKAYLDKYDDGICVFLDSELGANQYYFDKLGIDTNRVIHLPVTSVEDAKVQSTKILDGIETGEHAIIFFDSIGNLASKKEIDDAIAEKTVADMTRAKQLKSYFRIITPYLNIKKIPFIGVNHTYETISFLPTEPTMAGGGGCLYAADTVLFLSKSKDKSKDNELQGFNFKLKSFKSRNVREGSVFCLNSSFTEGIDVYSDLFEFAVEAGFITSPSKGFFQKSEKYGDERKYRRADFIRNDEIWKDIINDNEFKTAYELKFRV